MHVRSPVGGVPLGAGAVRRRSTSRTSGRRALPARRHGGRPPVPARGRSDYDRGLGTQSRTLLAYRLDPGDRRFQALVGLDDRAGPLGSVVFRVLVDGKERSSRRRCRSATRPGRSTSTWPGRRLLILVTEFGERGEVRDFADWVEASAEPSRPARPPVRRGSGRPRRTECLWTAGCTLPCRADKTADNRRASLTNLGHLSSAVGHHVINAFSAIVSNAELLRLKPPLAAVADPAALAETIVGTALDAATVARRLIDYTRPVTSIDAATGRRSSPPCLARPPRRRGRRRRRQAATGGVALADRPGSDPADPRPCEPVADDAPEPPRQRLRGDAPAGDGRLAISTSTDARGWVVLEVARHGTGMDARDAGARRRAVLQHQARPPRRRPEHRQRHLAPAPRHALAPQPARRRDHRPPLRRARRLTDETSRALNGRPTPKSGGPSLRAVVVLRVRASYHGAVDPRMAHGKFVGSAVRTGPDERRGPHSGPYGGHPSENRSKLWHVRTTPGAGGLRCDRHDAQPAVHPGEGAGPGGHGGGLPGHRPDPPAQRRDQGAQGAERRGGRQEDPARGPDPRPAAPRQRGAALRLRRGRRDLVPRHGGGGRHELRRSGGGASAGRAAADPAPRWPTRSTTPTTRG